MTQIKPNRRAHKTINKTYRFQKVDIWGHLGKKLRDKRVTHVVATQARMDLRTDLRDYPRSMAKTLRRYFNAEKIQTQVKTKPKGFLQEATKMPKQKRLRQRALRNTLLKLRKKLSLFYGGGKIRTKTYRRLSKLIQEKAKIIRYKFNKFTKNVYHNYVNAKNFTKFLESRLDILVLRSGLLTTIHMIRQAIVHRKLHVRGQKHINHPGFLVKSFRAFNVLKSYGRYTYKFFERIQKMRQFTLVPNYLWLNYATFSAFKFKEPKSSQIAYPFCTAPKGQLVFKFLFNKH